ncbi:MAG TPA: YcaO-like family protein [Bradyrhizobium sp.]|nr:YcaO-like family protein [Bradyrhizobium sp.]
MDRLFATAAALLRGQQPEGAARGEALGFLQELGYRLPAEGGPEHETLHRARLLEAGGQFVRMFQLGAPEAPGLFCFGAEVDPASIDPIHRGSALLSVSGVGLSMHEAFQSCVGEGIEYLSHLQSGDDRLVPAGAAGGAARLLPDFVAGLAGRSDPQLSWCAARRLTDGREVLLPADLCLRRPEARRDFAVPFPLSIGSAAGTSLDGALLHGLLELIERDAASLWWRGGRLPRAVDACGVGAEALLQSLRPPGFARRRSWLLDITTDIGVPTVAALSCGSDGYGLAFGLASRTTLARAARSAMLEMCQLELAYAVIEAKRRERGDAGLNAKDRLHLDRAGKINADRCRLLQAGPEPAEHISIDASEPRAVVEILARRLETLGIESFFIDLTRPRFTVPVARVMAPALAIEPSEIVTPRLAEMIARTGGGAVYTGGVALL